MKWTSPASLYLSDGRLSDGRILNELGYIESRKSGSLGDIVTINDE
jgi:hypothetical protein